MFRPISKHLDFRQKYFATSRIFNTSLFLMFAGKSDEILSLIFHILLQNEDNFCWCNNSFSSFRIMQIS